MNERIKNLKQKIGKPAIVRKVYFYIFKVVEKVKE